MEALTVSLVRDERYTRPKRVSIPYGHMDATGGARLRRLLADAFGDGHGWVTALANKTGLRRGTMYQWFNGGAEPTLETLRALSEATGLPRWRMVAAMDGQVEDQEAETEARLRAMEAGLAVLAQRAGVALPERSAPREKAG